MTLIFQSPFIVVPPSSEYGLIAPKVFGDLLESLAGAVFLDCGLDLVTVWQVFYPIMKNTIGKLFHMLKNGVFRLKMIVLIGVLCGVRFVLKKKKNNFIFVTFNLWLYSYIDHLLCAFYFPQSTITLIVVKVPVD